MPAWQNAPKGRKRIVTDMKIQRLSRGEKIFFAVTLLLMILSRTILLDQVPGDINPDEAMSGYNALTLLRNGTDNFGYPYPVYLSSWGSGQNVLQSWLQIPFLLLFGVSNVTARLPMVICSVLSLIALFAMARRTLGNRFALFLFFFASVTPWHLMASRWALEANLAPFFLLFGLFFFLKGAENPKWFPLSGLFYGLSLYTYATIWTVIPFILIAQILYLAFLKKLRLSRWTVGALAVLALLAAPLVLFVLINRDIMDEIRLPFLSIPRMVSFRSGELSFRDMWPKFRHLVKTVCVGDTRLWNTVPEFGLYYYLSLPFVPVGGFVGIRDIVRSLKEKRVSLDFFFLAMALGGTALGCVLVVNVNQDNIIHFPVIYFAARGLWAVVRKIRWKRTAAAVTAVYFLLFGAFEIYYFGTYRVQIQSDFGKGSEAALKFVKENLGGYGRVYLDWRVSYARAYFYLEEDVNTLTETVSFSNYPDPYLSVSSFDRYILEFSYDEPADLSAPYLLEQDSEGSVLVQSLLDNGYRVSVFDRFSVYWKE